MADMFLSNLKQCFEQCLSELDSIHSFFCKNPSTDFTRNRKISFSDMCRFLIQLLSKSLPNEVLDFFWHTISAPTASALIKQQHKILVDGFAYLLHERQALNTMVERYQDTKTILLH